ncbi:prostatic acid phosphatase [Leptinotarsa decemlineata]|uniref:prostatic acid phosphatase n=1 Tax=Leptinotarsa decemlineata TaxID=7539 RepID=UPI003D307A37
MLVRSFIIIVSLTSPIWARATLISVVQVFRHGERAPINHYPNDPYKDVAYWPVGPGQLTNVGKTQHFHLGEYTRQRYINNLPAAYSNNFFYAQTTDVDRTHMSAQCNLLGLFPPTETERWNPDIDWSPIPVHPSDPNVINSYPNCPAYDAEQQRVTVEEPYFQKIDEQYRDTYEYISNYSGSNITTLQGIGTVFDSLFIENELGYTLPSWTQAIFPEPLATLEGLRFQSYVYNRKLMRLSAGPFLNEVIGHFEKMRKNSSTAEFYRMYSAHDFNIAQVLSSLGRFNPPRAPYFASTIYFELWEFLGRYHVNIYYKDKDTIEKITPEGCWQFDCSLSKLKNTLSDILIDTDTLKNECVG